METLKSRIESFGGLSKAAQALDTSPQRLMNWIDRGVPIEAGAKVHSVLGFSRQAQRPHDWHLIWPELAEAEPKAA